MHESYYPLCQTPDALISSVAMMHNKKTKKCIDVRLRGFERSLYAQIVIKQNEKLISAGKRGQVC